MTDYSCEHLASLIQEAEAGTLDLNPGQVAPFKTAPTPKDKAQVAAVEAAVASEDSTFFPPTEEDTQREFVGWQ